MREEELYRAADEVKTLVPEARAALRTEFERRHLSVKTINWKAQPPRPKKRKTTTLVGDFAGEHREMDRGKYHAWLYVMVAFVTQAVVTVLLFDKCFRLFLGPNASIIAGTVLGISLTVAIYWNRWCCIEAYASEGCSGLINFSIFYVPLVALYYANYRGFLKLKGR
jgi:hypothetical protein